MAKYLLAIFICHLFILVNVCSSVSVISFIVSSITSIVNTTSQIGADTIKNAIKISSLNLNKNSNSMRCNVSTDCNPYYRICFSGFCIIKQCVNQNNCPDDTYCNKHLNCCLQQKISYNNQTISATEPPSNDKSIESESNNIADDFLTLALTTTAKATTKSQASFTININNTGLLELPIVQHNINLHTSNSNSASSGHSNSHVESSSLMWGLTIVLPMIIITSVLLGLICFCRKSLRRTAKRLRAVHNQSNDVEIIQTDGLSYITQSNYNIMAAPKPVAIVQPPTYSEACQDQLPGYNTWSKRQQQQE